MSDNIISGGRSKFLKYSRGYGEYFFEQADKFKDKLFQIDGSTGQGESYASVLLRSTRVAISLKELGVDRNDVLMSCTRNTPDAVIPHLSTLYLGAVISAVAPTQARLQIHMSTNKHPDQPIRTIIVAPACYELICTCVTPREWAHCMRIVSPKFVFVEEDLVGSMLQAIETLERKPGMIVMGTSVEFPTFTGLQRPSAEEKEFRPTAISDCHDTAFVLYSSGTTGLAKGICISHFKMINEAKNALHYIQDPSVTLNYAILFWISAVLLLTVTIEYGGTRLILKKFDAEELFCMIQKYKVTLFFSPPLFAYDLTNVKKPEKYNVSSLKLYLIGGSKISPKQLARTRKLFKGTNVSFVYGCTEVACFSTSFISPRDKHLLNRLESVGKPIKDVEMKVVDPETKQTLSCNKRGEICIKTIYNMKGYHGMDSSPYYDEQGFFKTGDIGYYDENNCVYIVDRIKEMFKYQNWHIVPSALESILLEHPQVKEAGVFGIPNNRDGHHPAACIVVMDIPPDGEKSLVDDVEAFFNSKVSDTQRLRGGIRVVVQLPRTPSSKLQRNKLLELFVMN